MLRAKIKDRVSVKSMLQRFNLLSVNQLSAQIKLLEVWKAKNVDGYALSFESYKQVQPGEAETPEHNLRPQITEHYMMTQ